MRLLRTVDRLPAKLPAKAAAKRQGPLFGWECEGEGPLGGVAVGLRHAARECPVQQFRDASGPEVMVLCIARYVMLARECV